MDNPDTTTEEPPLLIDTAVTFLLVGVANRLNRSASAFYRSRFGVGVQEWRLILVLGLKDELTVGDAAIAADIDGAAASRALKTLKDLDLVTLEATASRGRATFVRLTAKGRATWQAMRDESVRRTEQIVAGLSPDEIAQLHALLDRVLVNANALAAAACDKTADD